jgi:hypothetical protein
MASALSLAWMGTKGAVESVADSWESKASIVRAVTRTILAQCVIVRGRY